MSNPVNELLYHLQSVYLSMLEKPLIDMPKAELDKHLARMHEISLKILKLETSDLAALNHAATIEHDKLIKAVESLEYAMDTDPRSMQLLHSVVFTIHILSNFFKLLL